MAKDFRATQVETTKIILSGGIASSTIGGAIYSGSVATNRSGGIPSAMLNDVGTDVFLFVSGTKSNSDFTRAGVTLFGGDIVVSGTMYAERQVIEVDGIVDGDLIVTGNLLVKPDANSNVSVDFRNFAGDSLLTVSTTNTQVRAVDFLPLTDDAYDLGAANRAWKDIFLEGDITFSDAGTIATTAGDLSIIAANGSNDVVIKGDLVPQADNTYDLGTASLAWQDLHLEGDVLMTDAGTIATATGNLTVSATNGQVIVDANTSIVLDADDKNIIFKDAGVTRGSIVANTRLTISSSAGADMVLDTNGGSIRIDESGTEFFRITKSANHTVLQPRVVDKDIIFAEDGGNEIARFDSSLESFNINTNKRISFDGTSSSTEFISGDGNDLSIGSSNKVLILSPSPAESSGNDVNFYISGSKSSRNTGVKGTAVFGGDLVVSGNVQVRKNLEVNAAAGSAEFIHFGSTPGKEIISSLASQNQVLILSGGAAASPNEKNYPDLAFFVSGSIGSKGTAVKGTAVFGGDVVISGTLHGGSPLSVASDLLPSTDDTFDLGSSSLAWQDIFLEGDISFTDAGNIGTAAGDLTVTSAGQVIVDANTSIILDADDKNIIFKDAGVERGRIIAHTRLTISSSAGADIVLDANGGGVRINAATTELFRIFESSENVVLQPRIANKDIIFASQAGGEIARFDSSLESVNINTNKRISFDGTTSSTEFISGDGLDLSIGSSNKVLILSGGAPASPNEQSYPDTNFFVSGSIGSKGTVVKGTSVFGGDTVISGSLYVNDTIFSANDTDTRIVFSDDQIDFYAGNERLLKLDETADDEVVIGDGGDVNFRVATKGYGYNLYVKSEHNAGAENAISIRHASPQEVLHVSGSTRIDSEGRANVLFISGTLGTNSHQVLILSGGAVASTDESAAPDVAFYVSGAVGSMGTPVRGTSVFGGDVAISGSLNTKSAVYRNTGIFTSNFAIDGFSHFSLINTNAGHVTASLQPAAQAGAGRVLVFKDVAGYAATNKIVIKPAGSDKLEGINDELKITVVSGSISIISDGISNYHVFGERD